MTFLIYTGLKAGDSEFINLLNINYLSQKY